MKFSDKILSWVKKTTGKECRWITYQPSVADIKTITALEYCLNDKSQSSYVLLVEVSDTKISLRQYGLSARYLEKSKTAKDFFENYGGFKIYWRNNIYENMLQNSAVIPKDELELEFDLMR